MCAIVKCSIPLQAVFSHSLDPYLFELQLEAFKKFVEDKSKIAFVSFAANPYTYKEEGYKDDIHRKGRDALAFQDWKQPDDIGTGKIAQAVIKAIEIPKDKVNKIPENNLVPWRPKHGETALPHRPLLEALTEPQQLTRVESCLFKLYREERDEQSLADLIGIFGKTYPLLAYLFFLKDRSKYLPIAPKTFDRAFEHLGAAFKTNQKCSWKNYATYIALIGEIKDMLTESLAIEVRLLDAHSFAWMLARQMEREGKLADDQEYRSLTETERDALVRARIGQGRFRDSLIDYWMGCAVT